MTTEEFEEFLHTLSVGELTEFRHVLEKYLHKLYPYTAEWEDLRDPEWCLKASKRYEGQTEPCCECGTDYPRSDLAIYSEIYCAKCRMVEEFRNSTGIANLSTMAKECNK